MGGIGTEKAQHIAPGATGGHRVRNLIPAIGAVDIAMPQGAALQHAKLVQKEQRVVAGAVEMPVPGGALLIAIGRTDRAAMSGTMDFSPLRS